MRYLFALFFIGFGALNVWGAVTNQPWMLNTRRRQRIAEWFGETGAKVFYFFAGIVLVVIGLIDLFA